MFADIRNRKRWNRIILMEIFFDLEYNRVFIFIGSQTAEIQFYFFTEELVEGSLKQHSP